MQEMAVLLTKKELQAAVLKRPHLWLGMIKGLSTMIGRADKDASGKELDTAMRSKMNRLRIWDSRISTYGYGILLHLF
jgi:transcription initiation factor TFIIIB Brf1 subunit/transcription initiation factor TFIIB